MVFPYSDNKAAKVRIGGEKKFKSEGDWNASPMLFGQDKFPAGGNTIVVVEGEYDALSAYQMLGVRKVAVVSVRNGAGSALKDCKANYEYLDSFKHVVFNFDSDPSGVQAQAEASGSPSRSISGRGRIPAGCTRRGNTSKGHCA